MLERHIIQARARALAEKERSVQQQTKVQFLEAFITLPPGVYKELPHAFALILQLLIHYVFVPLPTL